MDPISSQTDLSKNRSRGWSNDMSSDAIKRRLQTVSELYQLWLGLKNAKRLGPVPQSPTRAQGNTAGQ